MSPRFPCVTQGVKRTLRPFTSRMAQFIVCTGFVNDETNGGWFLSVGRDANSSIGCLVQCLPIHPSMAPHLMQASQK